jgi:hypothetical protein
MKKKSRASRSLPVLAGATMTSVMVLGFAGPVFASTPFQTGDVAVYRVGTGTGTLSSTSAAVFIDEYSPTGTLVQSIPMPTTASGSNKPMVASGSATSEGELTLSSDGNLLVATGYDAATGVASIASTASTAVPRVIGLIDGTGKVDTSTALTDADTGNNPRSAVTTDGTTLWLAGAVDIRSTTPGASTSTAVATQNTRQIEIFNNQLYFSSASGSFHTVGTVGTGLPTSGPQTLTALPGTPDNGGSPYAYVLMTLGSGSTPDTLYIADNGNGTVMKFGLVSGNWVAEGSITGMSGLTGLTGSGSGGTATLFATTPSHLYKMTDTTGATGTVSGTATSIASAATNEAFRGVAFAPAQPADEAPEVPVVVALPIAAGLVFGGAIFISRRRRGTKGTTIAVA